MTSRLRALSDETRELEARLRAGTLEYYKEGAAGTVSVRRLTGTRSLAIDGKVDAFAANRTRMEEMVREVPGLRIPYRLDDQPTDQVGQPFLLALAVPE